MENEDDEKCLIFDMNRDAFEEVLYEVEEEKKPDLKTLFCDMDFSEKDNLTFLLNNLRDYKGREKLFHYVKYEESDVALFYLKKLHDVGFFEGKNESYGYFRFYWFDNDKNYPECFFALGNMQFHFYGFDEDCVFYVSDGFETKFYYAKEFNTCFFSSSVLDEITKKDFFYLKDRYARNLIERSSMHREEIIEERVGKRRRFKKKMNPVYLLLILFLVMASLIAAGVIRSRKTERRKSDDLYMEYNDLESYMRKENWDENIEG